MKKDPLVFIEHILIEIKKIEESIKGITKEKFDSDINIQDATVRRIEIIGEAAKNLPKDFKDKYPSIPWKDIIGMRDKIIHHYFGINLDTIWKVVQEDIPKLKENILKIKKELEKNSDK